MHMHLQTLKYRSWRHKANHLSLLGCGASFAEPPHTLNVALILLRSDCHGDRDQEEDGHNDGKTDDEKNESPELEEKVESTQEEDACSQQCGNRRVRDRDTHLCQGLPGASEPVLGSGVLVDMEKVDGVIHRQPDDGDEEDAFVLAKFPAQEWHNAKEHDRDAADVGESQEGNPPIERGQNQDEEGDDQGESHSHDGRLHHLVLCDHEEVQFCSLEAAHCRVVGLMMILPSVVDVVGLLGCVFPRVGGIEAQPGEGQGGLGRVQPESCQGRFCVRVEVPVRSGTDSLS
mmetsp:Transcript_41354/g.88833  ORF Transcript_41354/g.88833 Transcript_41354/m.88833 type:complete len:288 (-) Transcript_41354:940-1803(-)